MTKIITEMNLKKLSKLKTTLGQFNLMTLIQVRCTYSIKTYGQGAIKLSCLFIANITFLHHRPTNQLDMYDFSAADLCEY